MSNSSVLIVGPEGSGSMYLWDLVAKYYKIYLNGSKKKSYHDKLFFLDGDYVYHTSFPTMRPYMWLTCGLQLRCFRLI